MFSASNATRVGALSVVVLMAAIVGPQGLAVGPTTSRTATPELPTAAAMEARAVLASVPISSDFLRLAQTLAEDHLSYPVLRVGALSFPAGAIDVPWMDEQPPAVIRVSSTTTTGSSVSAPRSNRTPEAMPVQNLQNRVGDDTVVVNELTSMVMFSPSQSDLTGEAMDALDQVALQLSGNGARIQLLAYGGAITDRSIAARRLALRRALTVRNHLMERGINQERIVVRAMGGATNGGPSDRVDIVYPGQ